MWQMKKEEVQMNEKTITSRAGGGGGGGGVGDIHGDQCCMKPIVQVPEKGSKSANGK
jgi:hypothetical protein